MFNYKKVAHLKEALEDSELVIAYRGKERDEALKRVNEVEKIIKDFIHEAQRAYPLLLAGYFPNNSYWDLTFAAVLNRATVRLRKENEQKAEKAKIAAIVREVLAEANKPAQDLNPAAVPQKKRDLVAEAMKESYGVGFKEKS
jgi:hypothetical protein